LWLVASAWAQARGGTALALIVDHGLRAGSAEEAASVSRQLEGSGEVAVLTLSGLLPGPGIARRAREARLSRLEAEAFRAGATHLLLGHQRPDQAETLCLRLLDGSFAAGLAGIPALRFRPGVAIARPCLPLGRGDLARVLVVAQATAVDDPSNRSASSTRARLRRLRADPDGEGAATLALHRAAQRFAQARAEAEVARARLLARVATIRPEGFALLDPGGCAGVDPALLGDALSAVVRAVGGLVHLRRGPALDRLARCLSAGSSLPSLCSGGVLLRPWRGRLLVAREPAALAPPQPARVGLLWDRRWRVLDAAQEGVWIGPLGRETAAFPDLDRLPWQVRVTLPAFRLDRRLTSLPHLGYALTTVLPGRVRWQPPDPIAGSPFGATLT